MPNFIIRRVETLEVVAETREEAGKIAMIYTNSKTVEELSVDYYYDDGIVPVHATIDEIYELVPYGP